MNPTFFIGASSRRIIAGDVLNALGYRIRPYEVDAGRDRPRAREGEADHLRRARDATNIALAALCKVQADPRRGQGRPHARQAEGQHHRRVLGDDHRGRRQLPPAAVPRERGRRVRHPARHRVAALHDLGGAARHRAARGSPRRRQGASTASAAATRSASSKKLAIAVARRVGVRALLPDASRTRRGLHDYHLPDMDGDRRDQPRVLQQRPPRRRRPHGGRQADPERRALEGAHDAQREALRLHAERRASPTACSRSSPRSSRGTSSARSRPTATAR